MRKYGLFWIASQPIWRHLGPPFEPLRIHAKPLALFVQARRNETGHSNPIAIYRPPRLPVCVRTRTGRRSTTFYPPCCKITLVCNQQPSYTLPHEG
jgi:hypothetical protein